MPKPNPCPTATVYPATNGRNDFNITITIEKSAWDAAAADHDVIISLLSSPRITVSAAIGATGNCIKRESNGWAIHTQTNKSLYDTNITRGDAGKKTFTFDTYKKRPH